MHLPHQPPADDQPVPEKGRAFHPHPVARFDIPEDLEPVRPLRIPAEFLSFSAAAEAEVAYLSGEFVHSGIQVVPGSSLQGENFRREGRQFSSGRGSIGTCFSGPQQKSHSGGRFEPGGEVFFDPVRPRPPVHPFRSSSEQEHQRQEGWKEHQAGKGAPVLREEVPAPGKKRSGPEEGEGFPEAGQAEEGRQSPQQLPVFGKAEGGQGKGKGPQGRAQEKSRFTGAEKEGCEGREKTRADKGPRCCGKSRPERRSAPVDGRGGRRKGWQVLLQSQREERCLSFVLQAEGPGEPGLDNLQNPVFHTDGSPGGVPGPGNSLFGKEGQEGVPAFFRSPFPKGCRCQ